MRFFNAEHGDVSMMSEDVVFTVMATGEERKGREGVQGMFNYRYHIVFDAASTTRVLLFGENNAMLEGDFVGKHIGEFNGIPATGLEVHLPLCVVYEIENDQIKHDRVHFETPSLLKKLGESI
jgi:predicted ester cyclase